MYDFRFVLSAPEGTVPATEFARVFDTEQAAKLLAFRVAKVERDGDLITVDFEEKQVIPVDMSATVILEKQIALRVRQRGNTHHYTHFKGLSVKAPFLPLQMSLVECRQQPPDQDGNIASVVKLKKGFVPAITLNVVIDCDGRARLTRA